MADVKDGEWVTPVNHGYLMECCDCGLVHRLDFRVLKRAKKKGHATIQNDNHIVQFRAFREPA
jgi:Zn-finger protein